MFASFNAFKILELQRKQYVRWFRKKNKNKLVPFEIILVINME